MNLSIVWGFVSGIIAMSCIWVYAAHLELSCPQKSLLIMFTVLVSVSLAVAFTLIHEAGQRGLKRIEGREVTTRLPKPKVKIIRLTKPPKVKILQRLAK